jgi:hypothetical protein
MYTNANVMNQKSKREKEEASPLLLNEKATTSSFSSSSSRRSTWLRVGGVVALGAAGSIFAIVRSESASSSLFFLGRSDNAEERARLKPPAPARGSLRSSSSSSKLGAAAVEENVLKLGTGCSPLQQFLPFNDDATKNFHDVVGARIATKTMSNDFRFENALEMQPGSECGTFEVPLSSVAGMAAGEEFGFYLYSKTNSTFDINQRADIGCASEGDVRCPVAESPSPLAEMQCTQAFKNAGNVFYNRVFDGTTLSYNWGTCDEECSVKNPQCPVEETSTATAALATCNGGGIYTSKQGDKEYKFCFDRTGQTWDQAHAFCAGNNARLIAPEFGEYSAAVDAVCDKEKSWDCTWLDLKCDGSDTSCDQKFDDWAWLGTSTPLTQTTNKFYWDTMYKPKTIYGGSPGEKCAHWWYFSNWGGVWGPQGCSSTYYGAMCLMEPAELNHVVVPEPVPAELYEEPKCEGGEVRTSGGYEFCYGSKGKTWEQAEEFCEGNNMHLVEPTSEAYSAAVDAVCDHDCTWLNLRCDGSNQSCDTSFDDWSWVGADTKLADGKNNFIMGGDNTIYGGGQGETCGHWWYNAGTKSVWGPQYCSSTYYGALCLMKEPAAQ